MRPRQARSAFLASCALVLLAAAAPAADLSGASAWLNVSAPLSTAALAGKVLALDFADDHTIEGRVSSRQMGDLQAALGPGFAAIGVRSPMPGRPPESLDSLRLDVLRREIMFPVVVDSSGAVAAAYGVAARPVVVLLDASGAVQGRYEGIQRYRDLEAQARKLLEQARASGSLSETPIPLSPERDSLREGPLLFPTQLFFDARRGRLFVADTGHHRVVALGTWGWTHSVIGLGVPFFADGPFGEAGFDSPEGLAVAGSDLFVADTGHRFIRRLFLDRRFVVTYAGGEEAGIPRGLAASNDTLYSADPLNHALDAVDLQRRHFYRFAGTGQPGDRDGLLAVAQLREPAAAAVVGGTLWIADSRAASLRALPLGMPGLSTPRLSGPGLPLVRPVALAAFGERLLVADSGDGRVKLVDPSSGKIAVFADGLLQPSGVTVMKNSVIVSDTGRSRLLRYSADGRLLGELRVRGLKTPPPGPPLAAVPPRGAQQSLPAQRVRSGVEDAVSLRFELPAGYHLNPRAPIVYFISETGGHVRVTESTRKGVVFSPQQPIWIRFTADAERVELILNVDFYYCHADDKGPCLVGSKRYRVVLDASPSEKSRRATVVVAP